MEEQDNKTERIKAKLDEYNSEMDKLRKKNERLEESLKQHEEKLAEQTVEGKSGAGDEKPKEETPQEYAKRVLEGNV